MSKSLTEAIRELTPLGYTIGKDGKLAALTPEAKAAFDKFAAENQATAAKPYVSLAPESIAQGRELMQLGVDANKGMIDNNLYFEGGRQQFQDNESTRNINEYKSKIAAQTQALEQLTDRPYGMQEALVADQPVARREYINYRKGADTQNMIAKLLLGAGLMFS